MDETTKELEKSNNDAKMINILRAFINVKRFIHILKEKISVFYLKYF